MLRTSILSPFQPCWNSCHILCYIIKFTFSSITILQQEFKESMSYDLVVSRQHGYSTGRSITLLLFINIYIFTYNNTLILLSPCNGLDRCRWTMHPSKSLRCQVFHIHVSKSKPKGVSNPNVRLRSEFSNPFWVRWSDKEIFTTTMCPYLWVLKVKTTRAIYFSDESITCP